MKTETMLLLALLVAVGYFMWANNGAIRRALGMAPKEGMYSWSYINGKEGYEGANVDASMPAPVNGGSLSIPAAAANGMGVASSLLPAMWRLRRTSVTLLPMTSSRVRTT